MQKLFARLALVSFLFLLPGSGFAVEGISAEDTIAGFDSELTVSGLAANETLSLHLLAPSGEEVTIGSVDGSLGDDVTIPLPADILTEPGTYRVIALHNSAIVASSTFEVVTDRVDENASTVTAARATLIADGSDTVIVTVTLRDTQGNALSGRPVQLIGSRSTDRITALTAGRDTDVNGTIQFGVQTNTAGDIILRAMDLLSGTILTGVAQVTAGAPVKSGSAFTAQVAEAATPKNYDVLAGFEITPKEKTAKVGDVISLITVRAVDAEGNTVENFTGKVLIRTPNDPSSSLPGLFEDTTGEALDPEERVGSMTFSGKNRGVFPIAWTVNFSTPGEQRIVVTDESGTIRGETVISVTGNATIPDNRRIRILSPKQDEIVGGTQMTVQGTGPSLRNLSLWVAPASADPETLTEKAPAATGETDAKGQFSFDVKLPEGSSDVLIQIRDENSLYDSGIVRFKVDTAGPKLVLTIDPRKPQEGEPVTFTVESEPGLNDMTLHIEDREVSLTETTPGSYTVMVNAPARSSPEFSVHATDAAGNAGTAEGILSIVGPELPQVQNVKAESLAGGVKLTWDTIPDDKINAYRIEVGKTADRVDLTLDTTEAVGEGSVMGLNAGVDYFFAIRPISGGDVGPRSGVVSSRTLGMDVTVTPQDSGLMLQWTFPDATPLQSFELSYGFGNAILSEVISLDSDMRVFTLRDLLPALYTLKMTPIAVNGQRMDALAVTVTGTPLSGAFHPSAGIDNTIFTNPSDTAPPDTLHEGAPENPHVGIPNFAFWTLLLCASAGVVFWVRKRQNRNVQLENFLVSAAKRYSDR